MGLVSKAKATSKKSWESGSHSVDAILVDVKSSKIELKIESGKIVKVPISKLSAAGRRQANDFKDAEKNIYRFTKKYGMHPETILRIGKMIVENDKMIVEYDRLRARVAELEGMPAPKPTIPEVNPANPDDSEVVDLRLRFSLDENRVYILKNGYEFKLLRRFMTITFDKNRAVGGMFNVDGKPVKPIITSSDPTVVELQLVGEKHSKIGFSASGLDSESMTFLKPGTATLTVKLGEHEVSEVVEVVMLPFSKSDSSSVVVESFGFPNSKKQYYVSWPNGKTYDSIWYEPSAAQSIITPAHWRFDKYPGLVVSIVSEKVHDVGSYTLTEVGGNSGL